MNKFQKSILVQPNSSRSAWRIEKRYHTAAYPKTTNTAQLRATATKPAA